MSAQKQCFSGEIGGNKASCDHKLHQICLALETQLYDGTCLKSSSEIRKIRSSSRLSKLAPRLEIVVWDFCELTTYTVTFIANTRRRCLSSPPISKLRPSH
jgi:hypothetical protein